MSTIIVTCPNCDTDLECSSSDSLIWCGNCDNKIFLDPEEDDE